MLRIRKEQMTALERHASLQFENKMLEHIAEHFHEFYVERDESALRLLIQQTKKRAQDYGWASERDVCKYIDLTVALGENFETNPAYPQLQFIQADAKYVSSSDKLDALFDYALNHLFDSE